MKNDEKIKMFKEELDKINSDDYYSDWLTQEEEDEKWLNTWISKAEKKGEAKGEAKGKAEKSIEIAKNMLEMNLDLETISKATGLSIEEINNLK